MFLRGLLSPGLRSARRAEARCARSVASGPAPSRSERSACDLRRLRRGAGGAGGAWSVPAVPEPARSVARGLSRPIGGVPAPQPRAAARQLVFARSAGSTEVARLIDRQAARRAGRPATDPATGRRAARRPSSPAGCGAAGHRMTRRAGRPSLSRVARRARRSRARRARRSHQRTIARWWRMRGGSPPGSAARRRRDRPGSAGCGSAIAVRKPVLEQPADAPLADAPACGGRSSPRPGRTPRLARQRTSTITSARAARDRSPRGRALRARPARSGRGSSSRAGSRAAATIDSASSPRVWASVLAIGARYRRRSPMLVGRSLADSLAAYPAPGSSGASPSPRRRGGEVRARRASRRRP